MKRKIALKRLSASDLTLFEHQYRNTAGTKQKAINLDTSVFVSLLFPGLPTRLDVGRDRVIITLAIYGPAGAEAHTVTRKILKQKKNWRLNGELISNPPEESGRYDALKKGDYAIIDFAGNEEPSSARMYLVARDIPEDEGLHVALERTYGTRFTARTGMIEIDLDEFERVMGELKLPEGHPILDALDVDDLEDAAQGGMEGFTKLRRRRKARGVSRDELGRARKSAEKIGRQGEELLNGWLDLEVQDGRIDSFEWDADVNAVAPYDFSLFSAGQLARRVDAKSTQGDFTNPIHVSTSELEEMAYGGVPYDIYRLYAVNELTAKMKIATDLGPFAVTILEQFQNLPSGVKVDGVSIHPDTLGFGGEIVIDFTSDEVDETPSEEIDPEEI